MATQGPKTWPAWKDPEEIRDFGVDWTDEIGTLDIVTSDWTVVSGTVVVVTDSFDNADTDEDGNPAKTATVRLSGGAVGENAELLNHVVLDDSQEFEQTCKVKVRKR